MIQKILNYLQDITGEDFVFCWYHNGKRASYKRITNSTEWLPPASTYMSIGFDAYAKNQIINNTAAIQKYHKAFPACFYEYCRQFYNYPDAACASVDYPAFFDNLFTATRPDKAQITNNIIRLFEEEGRKSLSFHNHPDLDGRICASAYQAHPDLFYGDISISFSAFCLGDFLDAMAETFAQIASSLSDRFIQINASVWLQPRKMGSISIQSPYMDYFGNDLLEDNSHQEAGCTPKEWYPSYYLCGVEWFNVLSPLVKQHISQTIPCYDGEKVQISSLTSGALLVRSTKPISEYAYYDACTLKRLVIPALYPGRKILPLRAIYPWENVERMHSACPRADWEIVPIEKAEVNIVGTDIVFCSQNYWD